MNPTIWQYTVQRTADLQRTAARARLVRAAEAARRPGRRTAPPAARRWRRTSPAYAA